MILSADSFPKLSPLRWWQWVALAALLALAFAVRFREASAAILQQDELWSMELSTGRGSVHMALPAGEVLPAIPPMTDVASAEPWWRVPGSLSSYVSPPAYYTLLAVWRRMADGPVAAGVLSAILSTAAIGVYFSCVRRLVGVGAGLWTVALVGLSRPGAEIGAEVRPYALLLLAGALALRAWIGVVQTGRRRWVAGLVGAMLLLELTHYFALGLGLSMGMMSLVALRGRTRTLAAGAILGATAVFAIVWGPALHSQFAAGRFLATDEANTFLLGRGPVFPRELEWFCTLPARLIYVVKVDRESLAYWLSAVGGALWALPWVMARRVPGAAVLGWCAAGGCIAPLAMDVLHGTAHLEYLRYSVLSLPATAATVSVVPAWLGTFVTRSAGRWMGAIPAAACFAAANSLPSEYAERANSLAPIAAMVDRNVPAGAVLVFAGEQDASVAYVARMNVLACAYYGKGRHPMVLARGPLTAKALAEIGRLSPPGEKVWAFAELGSEAPWKALPGMRAVPGVGAAMPGAGQVVAFERADVPTTRP